MKQSERDVDNKRAYADASSSRGSSVMDGPVVADKIGGGGVTIRASDMQFGDERFKAAVLSKAAESSVWPSDVAQAVAELAVRCRSPVVAARPTAAALYTQLRSILG